MCSSDLLFCSGSGSDGGVLIQCGSNVMAFCLSQRDRDDHADTSRISEECKRGGPQAAPFVESCDRGSALDLDLDVDAGRQLDALERIDGLGVRLDDVDEALVDAHLEVLA